MPGTPVLTLKDLLLPNEEHDTHIIFQRVREGEVPAETSSFSLLAWDPERLPRSAQLFKDLPSRMHEHLRLIIDQHFSDQAARSSFTNYVGYSVAPNEIVQHLRSRCTLFTFNLSHEVDPRTISDCISYPVAVVYEALTGNRLDVELQEHSCYSSVITDHVFRLRDGIKILWAEKSSRAFDRFIGELMEQLKDSSPVELCNEPVATTYHGYKAILAKVRVYPCQISPI